MYLRELLERLDEFHRDLEVRFEIHTDEWEDTAEVELDEIDLDSRGNVLIKVWQTR